MTETDDEIRGEALVGLAQRGDIRTVEPLLQELKSHSPDVSSKWDLIDTAADSAIRAAKTSGDQKWLPVLEKMKTLGIGDTHAIQAAIERCMAKQP